MKQRGVLLMLLTLTLSSGSVFAQFSQTQMLAEWQRAKAYTKEYIDAMPEQDYSFKPTPEIRSYAEQMLHLASTNYFFASTARGIPIPATQTSPEEMVSSTK